MSDPFESRWFKIGTLVFTGGIIAYSAWTFSIIRNLRNYQTANKNVVVVNGTELTWEYWISLIILIIAVAFFIWALWKVVFAKGFREKVYKEVGEFTTTEEGGFYPGTETVTTTKTTKPARARKVAQSGVKASLYDD